MTTDEAMAEAIGSLSAIMDHHVIAHDVNDHGVAAICVCGWRTLRYRTADRASTELDRGHLPRFIPGAFNHTYCVRRCSPICEAPR